MKRETIDSSRITSRATTKKKYSDLSVSFLDLKSGSPILNGSMNPTATSVRVDEWNALENTQNSQSFFEIDF